MILYFSGTGNSELIAKLIAKEMNDEALNLFEKIRDRNYSEIKSNQPWIVVTPTYAWRIPRIVSEWINQTVLTGHQDIYFFMTCGGSIGQADKYLQKLCRSKNLCYKGCAEIVMPENYIALFETTPVHEIEDMIQCAKETTKHFIRYIKEGKSFPQITITFKDKLNSGVVNTMFYPMFVHAKKFHVTDQCISCQKCVQVCPLNNVQLKGGKPIWGKECTHCMACISYCPTQAIEYGQKTAHKVRYRCPQFDDK